MKSNSDLIKYAIGSLSNQQNLVIVIVTSTWGSSPRKEGSIMLVTDQQEFYGSVSGGCIEIAVVTEAVDILAKDNAAKISQSSHEIDNIMAWEHNLSCGGKVNLAIVKLDSTDITWLQSWLDCIEQRLSGEIAFDFDKQAINFYDTAASKAGDNESKFKLLVSPRPKVICIGAVHITQYLAAMANQLDYDLTVIEPRESWVKANPLPATTAVISQWPAEALESLVLDQHSAFITLTHDAKFDDEALAIAIDSQCFYIGALGSSRTHQKRLERLITKGFTTEQCDRIHGPIGLDIGAVNPAEIALSIWAEIVKVRFQNSQNQIYD